MMGKKKGFSSAPALKGAVNYRGKGTFGLRSTTRDLLCVLCVTSSANVFCLFVLFLLLGVLNPLR